MLAPNKTSASLLDKNTELAVRLKVSEEQNQLLRAENERLKKFAQAHEALKKELEQKTERTVLLEEELNWFRAQYFGRSTQKDAARTDLHQGMLFNEVEVLAAIAAADEADANRTRTIDAHERRVHTGGRKAIPEKFPRVVIPHDLPEDQKLCTECDVAHPLTRIGVEPSERYGYTPPKIWVERHERYKYVCDQRQEGVTVAAKPPQLLPKTNAGATLLAHLVSGKFDDGLPLYRLSRQLERSGMDLTPSTAGVWVNKIGGEKIVPLINLMNQTQLRMTFIHMDETYLRVLRSDRSIESSHYMVVRAAGPPRQRIILYNYIPARTSEAMKKLLIGPEGPYTGKLLTDGLERYDEICAQLKLLHFGCLQHCRAYFYKARKVSQVPSSRTLANIAIEQYIRKVFAVEDEIEKLRASYANRGEEFPLHLALALRQEKSKSLMDGFKAWIDKVLPGTPPNSALGQALAYTTRQWPKLVRFLDHPEVPAHNNYCEQQIKQYVIGRKAWLFNHDKLGAEASANLFSLVQTARANGLESYAYLCYLFDQLPLATSEAAHQALLPWNVTKTMLGEDQKRRHDLLESLAA